MQDFDQCSVIDHMRAGVLPRPLLHICWYGDDIFDDNSHHSVSHQMQI